jgi:hypothetical protein
MAKQCFIKKGSNPPICGVHEMELTLDQLSIDPQVPQLGRITCLICPASGIVVKDEVKRK